MKLTIFLHLVTSLRITGAIPLLALTAQRITVPSLRTRSLDGEGEKIRCMWTVNCASSCTVQSSSGHIYWLITSWGKVPLREANSSLASQEIPVFYGNQSFITMFTCGHHLPILSTPVSTTYPYSQPQSIQFTPSNSLPFKMHFNTILPFIPRFPTCFFLSRFPHVFSFQVSHVFSCHVSHMFFPFMFPHENPVFISLLPQKSYTVII